MNRIQKLSLLSALTITSGFATTTVGELAKGMEIAAGATVIVPHGTVLTNNGNASATGLNGTNSEAIDVRVGGSLMGTSGQNSNDAPGEDTGGRVEGLVIRHHASSWNETEESSGVYVPSTTHGFVSASLKVDGLKEMFDGGNLQTIYRIVGNDASIGAGNTIFLTTESKNPFGEGEKTLVTQGQLRPTQNGVVTFGTTVTINNSSDAIGVIAANLSNDSTDISTAGYTASSTLQLVAGAIDNTDPENVIDHTLTLSGTNTDFTGSLIIGDGETAGIVYMGAASNGNPKNALGGATNITVNANAELNLRGTVGDRIETNGNWDFFGNAKLTSNQRIEIKNGNTVTFGKSA